MQTIIHHSLEHTFYSRDIPVLKYTIEFPTFLSTCSQTAAQTANAHYASVAKEKEQYCRTVLYPQAAEDARYIEDNIPPFHTYEFNIAYTVPLNYGCITSLYFDQYTFMGGAHGSTVRTSDTWNFSNGRQMQLGEFFQSDPHYADNIQHSIEQRITEHLRTEPGAFFEDYAALIRKTFKEENYYLTTDGLVLYFQEYDIAPYAAGRPQFLLPFGPG